MKKFSFNKSEHLCSKKEITNLFEQGKVIKSGFIKLLYHKTPISQSPAVQVLISVSKRKIKKAHQRNLIKRRLRESYRLNKAIIARVAETNNSFKVALIYNSSDVLDYKTIEDKIILSLQRLVELNEESTGNNITDTH